MSSDLFDDSSWDEEECGNAHESFECKGGWHTCTDCHRGLGKRDYQVEPHNGYGCEICMPKPRGAGVTTANPNPFASDPAHTGTVSLKALSRAFVEGRADDLLAAKASWSYLGTVIEPVGDGKFVTKDSGSRQQFESGMQRDTQDGKARWDLLFPLDVPYENQFLTRVADLLARGAEKYDARNWEQASGAEELERFKASALRHMMQWVAGDREEDHAAAVCFNLLGYETTLYKLENNDGFNEAQ